MDLSNLQYPDGARKRRKRVGRGFGSGWGKTSGRGHNGYYSRGGSSIRYYFEGGQMPLQRRVPKFGFKNINKKDYQVVNIGRFNIFEAETTVDLQLMQAKGLISDAAQPVKVLGNGELTVKLSISANKFSQSAIAQIEKAGGSAEVI